MFDSQDKDVAPKPIHFVWKRHNLDEAARYLQHLHDREIISARTLGKALDDIYKYDLTPNKKRNKKK